MARPEHGRHSAAGATPETCGRPGTLPRPLTYMSGRLPDSAFAGYRHGRNRGRPGGAQRFCAGHER
jgi:hypothetical protein